MTSPTTSRTTQVFTERADALAHFFQRAGEAPRLVAYDEDLSCPLDNALAALEWATAVGFVNEGDLIHAAHLAGETAAVMVERRLDENRTFVYIGPRMDAPPASPYEGSMLYDEPGARAYLFAQKAHALAHFLRATGGAGALLAVLSRRAPQLIHVKRWLSALFTDPNTRVSNLLLTGWFATSGAGFLFTPSVSADPYIYEEIGADG